MNVQIKKVSTQEENVSLRTITFEVYVDGEWVADFDDRCDAEDFVNGLENA
ncbi:MAG: hypothetical protein AB7F96_22210 [Beijerinckiaceae bacterium]